MPHIRLPRRRGGFLLGLILISGMLIAWAPVVAEAQPVDSGRYSSTVELVGAVQTPQRFTLADLQRRPAVLASHHCIDTDTGRLADHAYRGVRLWDALEGAGIAIPAGISPPIASLRASLVATGSDGYGVLIALAEIDPAFNGREAIVAYEWDGQLLGPDEGMAMLVLPDDRTCSRNVFWLTRLEVRFI